MTEGGGGGRGSQGGRGDEVSATEVRERVSVSWAEQLQAAHISPGIYICSVLFLHRLISHMHVFVPPLPNSPLLFSFPNRSLANFLLISYFSLPFFFSFSLHCFFRLRLCLPSTFSPRCLEAVQ